VRVSHYVVVLLAAVLVLAAVPGTAAAVDAPGIAWQKLLGGSARDVAQSVQQTSDGGYIFLGSSLSNSGDATGLNHGGIYTGDFWLVKTNAAGAIQWQKLLGGSKEEEGFSVQQTADGGFIAFGSTNSNANGDVSGTNRGSNFDDYWLVKVSGAGALEWERLMGGPGLDKGRYVQQTSDGGYILVGNSDSNKGGDVIEGRRGDTDIWVVKVNATGAMQWQHMIGGSSTELAGGIQQTSDGGYILLGSSGSNNFDASGTTYGGLDLWIAKLGATGAIDWQKHLGGNLEDKGYSVRQTADGGYILLGESKSSASGDVTAANHGAVNSLDVWAVKLDSSGGIQWQKLLGGSMDDYGSSIRQTTDGGYILLGSSASSQSGDVTGVRHGTTGTDLWAVNLDGSGNIRWQHLLGGGANEVGTSVQQTADGGYVLTGYSGSSASGDVTGTSHGSTDTWLVKLNATALPVSLVPGGTGLPTDTNADGMYDDVNGNGRKDFGDVVLFFNQITWIAASEPLMAFDCNANGRIDFADVVWLFDRI
jgi:PKD repeat protein